MILSCGKVNLRPRWETGKVVVQRHSIWLSRGHIIAIWRGGSPLRRHCWQVDTRSTYISISSRPIVARSVSFEACHDCCLLTRYQMLVVDLGAIA